MTKDESIKKFEKAFIRRFGKSHCRFSHQNKDDEYELPESINVSVSLAKYDFKEVQPIVEKVLKSSGASRYFEIGGAGCGLGWRDVSIYRR